jgi:hypothetical protein
VVEVSELECLPCDGLYIPARLTPADPWFAIYSPTGQTFAPSVDTSVQEAIRAHEARERLLEQCAFVRVGNAADIRTWSPDASRLAADQFGGSAVAEAEALAVAGGYSRWEIAEAWRRLSVPVEETVVSISGLCE